MKDVFIVIILLSMLMFAITGCDKSSDTKDRSVVDSQQDQYGKTQPIPMYDYSIPRDIVIQIYNIVTQEARNTYTVIETMSGVVKFHGPSIGYGIPADVQLTNPLKPAYKGSYESGIIEQAEPNGLYSSKNTDGTWVLFVDDNGDVTPIYTEHKVTTYPFAVKQDASGAWVRADDKKASFTIKVGQKK